MYIYDQIDQQISKSASRSSATRPSASWPASLSEDDFRPLAAAEWPLHSAACAHAADRDPVRHARFAPAAQARAHHPHLRPRHGPFQHAPEPPAQLAEARGRARHPRRARDRADARHPDERQLHPQHHDRSLRRHRARRNRRSAGLVRNRAPVVRRSIPSSRTCRASSRSRSLELPSDRAAIQVHDVGLQAVRDARWRDRLPRACRRRTRPHADHRSRHSRVPAVAAPADVSRSDPARLQPLWPARQQVEGAHQDPGEGPHARRLPRAGRGRMAAREGRPLDADGR